MGGAASPAPPAGRERLERLLRARSVAGSMAWTMGTSAVSLVLLLFTGVLNARLLGPAGRGQVEAIGNWLRLGPIVTGFGAPDGLAYEQARDKRVSATLNLAAVVIAFVVGTVTFLVAQLLIPYGFQAQSDEVVQLARIGMIGLYAVLGTYLIRALFVGADYFIGQSLLALAEPVFYAGAALALWRLDAYSVRNVLFAQIGSFAAVSVIGAAFLVFLGGLAVPTRAELRAVGSYGLRSHIGTLGTIGNSRLDVLLMPAFLAAREIGLYAVAVSVASMMVQVFGQMSRVVFTSSVGVDAETGARLIERSCRLILAASAAAAVVTALAAPIVIPFVYRDEFTEAVTPLRVLLPGIVFWTAGMVLEAALSASGRPGQASLSQLYGLVLTVAGLWWSLPRYGIIGAAATSSVAYLAVFLVRAWYLERSGRFSTRRVFSPSRLVEDLRVSLARLR